MKDQPCQLALGVVDEGIEQRVTPRPVHPAQRGVRRHTVDTNLQPLSRQLGRQRAGLRLVKVPTVAHTPHHGETPGLQGERQLGSRHHIPDHGAALQIGITVVAGVVRQTQVCHRKASNLLRQGEPGFEFR